MIPSYPLHPANGGPLHLARPKRGQWTYEPKINCWRALVHTPTSRMWNRRGERLSIEKEFAAVLEAIRTAELPPEMEWLDCEALERRHALGRGSLVILDYLAPDKATYDERRKRIRSLDFIEIDYAEPAHIPNESLIVLQDHSENLSQIWDTLQECNKLWNPEVFEGVFAKRIDSPSPRQLRSPNQESPHWVKRSWDF